MGKATRLELLVLVDNSVSTAGFLAEWGLSVYLAVYGGEGKAEVLLDFGSSDAAIRSNMRRLGLKPEDPDVLVLSHGHYDHSGGLPWLLSSRRDRPVLVLHPDALKPKFALKRGVIRSIGLPFSDSILRDKTVLLTSRKPFELAEGVYYLGEIRRAGYPEYRGNMYTVTEEGLVEDPLLDDTGLAVSVEGLGLIVVTGCGHSGVLNIVEHAASVTGEKVYAVIGGLHMKGLSDEEAEEVVRALKRLGVEKLAPLHCSGETVRSAARRLDMLLEAAAGSRLVFEA